MIFGKPEQAPASDLDVGVGAQAQIGPMHVGVRVDPVLYVLLKAARAPDS